MQVKALACELPATHGVPLSRWSRAELARHVAGDRPPTRGVLSRRPARGGPGSQSSPTRSLTSAATAQATACRRPQGRGPSTPPRFERSGGCHRERPRHRQAHVANVPNSFSRILLQTGAQEGPEHGRQILRQRAPIRVAVNHTRQRLRHVPANEWPHSGEYLVENHPERPHIRPSVHRLAARLLGSHVRRRPHDHAHLRSSGGQRRRLIRITSRRGVERLRQTEVQDLDGPVLAHLGCSPVSGRDG